MNRKPLHGIARAKIEINLRCDVRCSPTNFHTKAMLCILISFVDAAAAAVAVAVDGDAV